MALIRPREVRFIKALTSGKSPEQSALEAGYSPGVARNAAAKILSRPSIRHVVRQEWRAVQAQSLITISRLLHEISHVAFSDIGDIIDFSGDVPALRRAKDIPVAARKAISSIKVKRVISQDDRREVEITEIKLWDKGAAQDKIARHLGFYLDQLALDDLKARVEAMEKKIPPEPVDDILIIPTNVTTAISSSSPHYNAQAEEPAPPSPETPPEFKSGPSDDESDQPPTE